jgi:hypothetical protein
MVIGYNHLGETVTRHFYLVLLGSDTVSSFSVLVESTRKKAVLSLRPSLESWEVAGVCVTVSWGSLWAVVWIYFCVLLGYYGCLPSHHLGRYVTKGVRVGRWGDCLLRLFCFVLHISMSCIDLLM